MEIMLTAEDIENNYSVLQKQTRIYNENKEYVRGENPTILRANRKRDPDNRIPIPLAKSAVEDMTGYAGANIKVDYAPVEDSELADDVIDRFQLIMNKFQQWNEDHLITTKLYREALSQMETYLLLWISDETPKIDGVTFMPEYEVIGMNEMVIVWSDDIKPKKLAAIRYIKDKDETKIATVYYPGFYEVWKKGKGEDTWKKDEDLTREYPYTSVPVCLFKIDYENGPLFQAEKITIDMHDSAISKSQNELDRYNALIALFPGKVDAAFVRKLEELKVLDELAQWDPDQWPRYLEKNLQGIVEYTNNHLDRLERLFHKTIKVVDFNQIVTQGGDESGTARAFKLLGMEFKASEIEKVFNKGFNERAELFDDLIRIGTAGIDPNEFRTVVTAKRNLPIDELNKLALAEGLSRLGVRKETILKVLPGTVIEDYLAEAEAMEENEIKKSEEFARNLQVNNANV